MKIRHSTTFTCLTALNLLLVAVINLHAVNHQHQTSSVIESNKLLVRKLRLTDLCLFTEARYTRHPSMADYHAAFQEHPAALDHFPSGSMLLPDKSSARTNAENP